MAGLEPASEGVKVPCLTTWLHPYVRKRRRKRKKDRSRSSGPSALYVGWVKGFEPSTPGTTIRCSNQLSYTHQIFVLQGTMARLKGLEPLTHCLEGSCSIHLSYRRLWSG